MVARAALGPVGVGLVLAFLFAASLVLAEAGFSGWDFRNNLWGPAHLVWLGQSAYAIHRLFPDGSNAIWFPQAIGVFAPLGLLPLRQASSVWLLLNTGALTVTGWSLFRRAGKVHPEPWRLGIVLLLAVLFPPTIHHFVLGQIGLIIVLALLYAAHFIERDQLLFGALFLAFGLTKPQLCLLLVPAALGYLVVRRRLNTSLTLAGYIVVASVIMTTPLWLADIAWWVDFIANLQRNRRWQQPSTLWLIQSHAESPVVAVLVFSLIFVVCLVAATYLWIRNGPVQGTVWGLALTTIAGTYIWSWDFVLLLPLLIDTVARAKRLGTIVGLLAIWLGTFVFTLLSLQPPPPNNARLWWLPYWVFFGLVACRRLEALGRDGGGTDQVVG